jgi:hypothetical protein
MPYRHPPKNNICLKIVTLDSTQNTKIDERLSTQNTSNVKYGDSYYRMAFMVADKFPPAFLPITFIAGISISLLAIYVLRY